MKRDRRSLLSLMGAMAVPGLLPSGGDGWGNGRSLDAAPAAPQGRTKSSNGRPNVIVVVTDDMRASDWQALPETARIVGKRGTVYPNFILNTPICGPSRATLFTGRLPHNHGVLENNAEMSAWEAMMAPGIRRATIYNAARQAGYRTAIVGKFMNGVPKQGRIAPGLDEWYSTSELDYFDFSLNENGIERKYGEKEYSTDVLADRAIDFIESIPSGDPFLLFYTPKAPKGPATPNTRFENDFARKSVERSPAWNEADVSDKPSSVRRRDAMTREEIIAGDDKERRRLATLSSVDLAVSRIWRSVRKRGLADSTVLMVMSDNGYTIGTHLLDGKGRPYDEIVRVPMMACGPGFAPGTTDERMVSMADIAPTLAGLMGARLPRTDGVSLLDAWQREFVPILTAGGKQGYAALRSRYELYVEYDDGEREYYDYRTDPYELDNALADWEGHSPSLDPARAAELASRLQTFRTCSGASCRGTAG
jgi:N-acetylglucosamine-6-sulfatase